MARAGRMAGRVARIVAAGLALGGAAAAQSARPPAACQQRITRQDRLVAVDAHGDLVLESGRRGRLDGLRRPEDPALAAAATAWLLDLRGRPLATREVAAPDRWGRVSLDAATRDDDAPVDLAGGLVAAGLAQVDAGEADTLCRPGLLAVEATARREGKGVWAAAAVIPADDAARLVAAAGRFVLIEGRVRSVGERERRTYLNFAPFGEDGLSVTMQKRTWRILVGRGLTAAALRGRRVRARGTVELWRGPTLDLGAAEMIELLDEEQAQRR
ncbi:MAG: DNA-binding protein [Methylobacterium frigidaeris]